MRYKKIILTLLIVLLIVSVQAQRRYDNLPRVKVERQSVEYGSADLSGETRMNNKPVEMVESKPANFTTVLNDSIIYTANPPQVNFPFVSKRNISKVRPDTISVELTLWETILKEHRKLSEVKDTKKTLLRTWIWLLIATCIILVVGVVLLILGFSPGPLSKGALDVIGIIIGGIGFIGAIVVLALGLSGRI